MSEGSEGSEGAEFTVTTRGYKGRGYVAHREETIKPATSHLQQPPSEPNTLFFQSSDSTNGKLSNPCFGPRIFRAQY